MMRISSVSLVTVTIVAWKFATGEAYLSFPFNQNTPPALHFQRRAPSSFSTCSSPRSTTLICAAIKEKSKQQTKSTPVDRNVRLIPRHNDLPSVEITSSDLEHANTTAAMAAQDVSGLMEEISNLVSAGTADLLKNLTDGIDERLMRLPEEAAEELSKLLADLANDITRAQQRELERQLGEIDKRFLRPLEDLAFSDVPLLEVKADKKVLPPSDVEIVKKEELILLGENSTLDKTRRMRTRDILRNFNVAPFYYSISLLARYVQKASTPPMKLISLWKALGSLIKSNTKPGKKDKKELKSHHVPSAGGESLQAGWKRTGEIAAKGRLARQWAIMRRSAEIWAYFSSFYLKDRRITKKFASGKWSEKKFKEERSKLGAEITQNLLKLGPVRALI